MPIYNLKIQKEIEIIPGYHVKFVHGELITAAYFRITAGADMPEHSHLQEQICNVIEGRLELTVEGKSYILERYNVFHIPSHAKHKGKALTDCIVLDVFSPVREDYKRLSEQI
jgi:quercetin dioxygenase-like cupin family protein